MIPMPPTKPRTLADLKKMLDIDYGMHTMGQVDGVERVEDLLRTSIRELDEEIDTLREQMKKPMLHILYANKELELRLAEGARDFAVKLLNGEKGEKI